MKNNDATSAAKSSRGTGDRENGNLKTEHSTASAAHSEVTTRDGAFGAVAGRISSLLLFLCGAVLVAVNLWLLQRQMQQLQGQAAVTKERQFWLLCHPGSTAEKRVDAFLALVAAGNMEWRGARLSRMELESADFDQVFLENAVMDNSNLQNSTMVQARLNRTSFRAANLTNVDFSSASLVETYMLKAKLDKATFNGANLSGASLEQASMKEAELALANLTEANLLMTDLTDAVLTGADLQWSNLQAAILVGADLGGANLDQADLTDADFTDSNWWRATGLDAEWIKTLKSKYPPSPEARPAWKADYEQWLME